MFDRLDVAEAGGTTAPVPTLADVAAAVSLLNEIDARVAGLETSDAERVDLIRGLEEVKSAAAAAQAQVAAAFAASQTAERAAAGVEPAEADKGVAAQVGLAKRQSPFRARRYLGWAKILTTELPHTLAALRSGETTEWRAMLVGRETGWLSAEHRAQVDAEFAGRLEEWGDGRTAAEARKAAIRLDPRGAADRARKSHEERRVSLRPAPDTMSYLTALLPVRQGVAVLAALSKHADSLRSDGDPRSRGQLMADTLVERVTGQQRAEQTPVEVQLVMTGQALLGDGSGVGSDEPAHLSGYGPLPAPLARRMLAEADEDTAIWLRRLYTTPSTGQLVAMESTSRRFPTGLRQFLVTRDQRCRTPWCDAPIRHADHVRPVERGGPTSADNGQGLCEACNQTKDAFGWRSQPDTGGAGDSVVISTPTGHTYTSRPPDPPGKSPPVTAMRGCDAPSRFECCWREVVLAA